MADYSGSSSPDRQQHDACRRQRRTPRNTRTSHFGSGSRNHLKATATAAKTTASPAQAPIRTWITVAPPGATVIADSATKARTKRTAEIPGNLGDAHGCSVRGHPLERLALPRFAASIGYGDYERLMKFYGLFSPEYDGLLPGVTPERPRIHVEDDE